MKNSKLLTVAVIGANSDSIHAIKTAKKFGAYVIALDEDHNAGGLRYANKSFIVDIKDHDQIYNVLDHYCLKLTLPTPIGRYLTSIGAINDHYGLPGVSLQSATACTDKYIFNMMLYEKGKRQAEHILIQATDTAPTNTIDKLSYPIVVKPRHGSGSRDVQIFVDPLDFQHNFLKRLPLGEDFIVENLVQGVEYGVDAAMICGEFHLVLLREKLQTPPPYCQCVGYYSVPESDSNKTLFHSVRESVAGACRILGCDNCLLHADVIYHHGESFIIEISARPSGHHLHDLFTPLATGVDMIAEYLHFALPQLEQEHLFTPVHTKNMIIRYFDFAHCRIKHVPDAADIKNRYSILEYKCNLQKDEVLLPVKDGSSLMGRGYYIVEGANRNELDSITQQIVSEFVIEAI